MARRVPVQVLPGCRGRVSVPELRRIVRYVLGAEDVAPEVEVEIVLADVATVRNLNRLYRGRDEPTDVLSFSATDAANLNDAGEPVARPGSTPSSAVAFIEPPDETASLGEIVVCIPVAEAQAIDASAGGEPGRTVGGAIAHLIVHGLLHLLAYDHEESETDSKRMQTREDELLSALGYAGAYAHGH